MISGKLIQLIEDNADALAKELLKAIQTNSKTSSYNKFSSDEMYLRTFDVYNNLGKWLGDMTEDDIKIRYMRLGARRYKEDIPISEVVFALILTMKILIEFVKRYGLTDSALELHQELELFNLISQFVNQTIYYTVLGYEMECDESKEKQ